MTLQRFITRTTLLVQERDAAINEAAFGSVSSRKTRAALGMEAAAAPLMRQAFSLQMFPTTRRMIGTYWGHHATKRSGGFKFGKKLRC